MKYWIFVTTERKTEEGVFKPEDIYTTRMKDQFWGLGEKTPNRKNLNTGDKVIFYVGYPLMVFAGVCVLGSQSYELGDDEKEKYSHDSKFYLSDFGAKLEEIEIWENPKPVKELITYLSFIENKPYWGTYFQGGVRQISEEDYLVIVEGQKKNLVEQILSSDELENQTEFALEAHLEDFLYRNWESINWGSKLRLYKTDGQDGRQFPAGPWSIDLLAIEEETNDLVVIELKRGKSSDATLGQILRYISWVKENIADESQSVNGIIIAKDVDDALSYGVKSIGNVKVKTYQVDFQLVPHETL